MSFKNIKKIYVLKKSLEKQPITASELYTLYSVHLLKDMFSNFTTIDHILKKHLISKSSNFTSKHLKQLLTKGYIKKDGKNYLLTIAGETTLSNVERKLRVSMKVAIP